MSHRYKSHIAKHMNLFEGNISNIRELKRTETALRKAWDCECGVRQALSGVYKRTFFYPNSTQKNTNRRAVCVLFDLSLVFGFYVTKKAWKFKTLLLCDFVYSGAVDLSGFPRGLNLTDFMVSFIFAMFRLSSDIPP